MRLKLAALLIIAIATFPSAFFKRDAIPDRIQGAEYEMPETESDRIQLSTLSPPPGWASMRVVDYRNKKRRLNGERPGGDCDIVALKRGKNEAWIVALNDNAAALQRSNNIHARLEEGKIGLARDLSEVRALVEEVC